jgi:hypothetical protein
MSFNICGIKSACKQNVIEYFGAELDCKQRLSCKKIVINLLNLDAPPLRGENACAEVSADT